MSKAAMGRGVKRIGVIGAGAAGLIAGAFAAANGCEVDIIDGNEKAGKKLFLTGKGRCNITNSADLDEFLRQIPHNGRFLYGAFGRFFNNDIIKIINAYGVPTKLERGGRYFPESDKSSDVIRALTSFCAGKGANLVLNSLVTGLDRKGDGFTVHIKGQPSREYDSVILATGGMSYASTGSTGDGFRFAKALGHTVTELKPSLIPLVTAESWPCELMGLSHKNVTLRAYKHAENAAKNAKKRKPVYEELGEMLFTHFGVSGPLVLSASSYLAEAPEGAELEIDIKPALSHEVLDARVLRDFEKYKHKQVRNAMVELLPQRLIDTVLALAEVEPETTIDCLTREQRLSIVGTMKCMRLTVKCARPMNEAIITRGGIPIKEVNPSTMESKLVPGLFFAGEVLDVDAHTGGFNLQIAFSSGAAAGKGAASRALESE